MNLKLAYLAARLLLGGTFLYSGILKIGFPLEFADSIDAYQLLPNDLIYPVAAGLPIFELICGLSVLVGAWDKIGILGMITMLVVFSYAILSALKRGLPIDCGCFGGHSWIESHLWAVLGRNIVLLVLSTLLYLPPLSGKGAQPYSGRLER